MFTILCQETAAEQSGLGQYSSLLMILGIFVVFYFFMIRPQQKKQKEIQKMREALTTGSSVVTAGGIHGVIRQVADKYFIVEIANGVRIRVEKGSVYASADDAAADAKDNK